MKWKLDLDSTIPYVFKPCDFALDMIIEAVWLPYRNDKGEIDVKPSLLIKTKSDAIGIWQFDDPELTINVKGTFPSQELKTLMNVKAVKMVKEEMEIDARKVDEELDEIIRKHAELGNKRRILLKRWIEGTYFYNVFDHYPILNIMGVSGSGKSRILKIIQATSYHADSLIDPTEAVIFRSKEEDRITLCWDEAEYLNIPNINQVIRTLINASYSKGAYVHRYDEIGGKRIKRKFDLYSPMAIVGISGLYGVTSSRAIQLITERSNKDYPIAKTEEYENLRDRLYVLKFDKTFELRETYEKINISNIVTARFEELFKPLFALTKVFGTNEEYEALSQWAKMYQETFRAEALNIADEEQILMCLTDLTRLPDDWYSVKELTERIFVKYGRNIGFQKVSRILKRIGITERRKVKGVTQFRATKELIEQVFKRLGLEITEKEQSTEYNPFLTKHERV